MSDQQTSVPTTGSSKIWAVGEMALYKRALLATGAFLTFAGVSIGTDVAFSQVGDLTGGISGLNLWALVQEGGRSAFIGLLFYLWLYERAEARKERSRCDLIQKEKEAIHERVLNTLHSTGNTIDDIVRLLSGGKGVRKE
jgi:hypothetical protein